MASLDRIDVHAHAFPEAYLRTIGKRYPQKLKLQEPCNGKPLIGYWSRSPLPSWDLDARIAEMDRDRVRTEVLSAPTIYSHLDDQSAEEEPDGEDEPGTHWLVEIVVQRHGELRLPLPIEWTFAAEDADSEPRKGSHVWTREEQEGATWWRLRLESRQKLESVVLDPERGIYLDGDMSDNQWFAERERLGTWRWAERVFTQYAHQMHWRSRLGG